LDPQLLAPTGKSDFPQVSFGFIVPVCLRKSDSAAGQGCQIFLDAMYQNWDDLTGGHKIYQIAQNKANGRTVY
jgi:hypothetical protein